MPSRRAVPDTGLTPSAGLGEWNRYENPAHHVTHLEIPLWAFGVYIVTIGAPLREGFIGIECMEDASLAFDSYACIGPIGILEDLGKRGPFKLGLWPIPFITRPAADQPESNPIWIFSHEPPCFE